MLVLSLTQRSRCWPSTAGFGFAPAEERLVCALAGTERYCHFFEVGDAEGKSIDTLEVSNILL